MKHKKGCGISLNIMKYHTIYGVDVAKSIVFGL